MKNKGYIYKIKNNINGKMYVGQTRNTIEKRFKEHISDSSNTNKKHYPLYKAFKKYGIKNFELSLICECDISELDNKEIKYIKLYNTYRSGYNATLGGSGGKTIDVPDEVILNTYLEQKSIKRTMETLNIGSHEKISETLKKYDVEQFPTTVSINIYKDDELIKCFNSLIETAKWIIDQNLTKEKKPISVASTIRKRIILNKKIYGYIFKSDYYSEEYLKDRNINYIYSRGPSSKYSSKKYEENKIYCPVCNKNKINKKNNKCRVCENNIRKNISDKKLNNKISREHLKELIRTTPFTTIANQYKVSDNTIRKWCRKYNLPYKSSEIKKYTDEEWKNI